MVSDLKQLVEYRDLLRTLVSKDIRSRYKGSVLGFAWNFTIPLLQLFVFWLLFGMIFKIEPPGDYPFALFLFTGLLPWNFLADSLTGGATSITANANLVKKIYFPLQVLPLTSVLSRFVNLLLSLVVLGVVVLAFRVGFSWYLLLLPVPLIVQIVFVSSFAYILACANVFYRDVQHILGILLMAWMYVTPILYPISLVKDRAGWAAGLINLNPATGIITAYQSLILDHRAPDWTWLGYSAAVALAVFIAGFYMFNRFKFRFEEEV